MLAATHGARAAQSEGLDRSDRQARHGLVDHSGYSVEKKPTLVLAAVLAVAAL
jgi:hypothetical protein